MGMLWVSVQAGEGRSFSLPKELALPALLDGAIIVRDHTLTVPTDDPAEEWRTVYVFTAGNWVSQAMMPDRVIRLFIADKVFRQAESGRVEFHLPR